MKNLSVNVDWMHMFVMINNVGKKIDVDVSNSSNNVNPSNCKCECDKNCYISEYLDYKMLKKISW